MSYILTPNGRRPINESSDEENEKTPANLAVRHAEAAEHATENGDFDKAWQHSLWSRYHHSKKYPKDHEYRRIAKKPEGEEPDPSETIEKSKIQKPPSGKIVE